MILNKRGLFACALLINVVVDAYASSKPKSSQSNENIQPINNFNGKPEISNTAKQKEIGDITQARNELNQIYWRIQARSMRNYPDLTRKHQWIKQEDYEQSIENVIGKAIADRITNMNEFKDKGLRDLITFDGLEYEDRPENYTQENWNAVVLYNFINRLYWEDCRILNDTDTKSTPDIFDRGYFLKQIKIMSTTLQANISSHYHNYLEQNQLLECNENEGKEKIENAISEIIAYFKALNDMSTCFADICKHALMYDKSSDDSKLFVCPHFKITDAENHEGSFIMNNIYLKGDQACEIKLNCIYKGNKGKSTEWKIDSYLDQEWMQKKKPKLTKKELNAQKTEIVILSGFHESYRTSRQAQRLEPLYHKN